MKRMCVLQQVTLNGLALDFSISLMYLLRQRPINKENKGVGTNWTRSRLSLFFVFLMVAQRLSVIKS